MERVRSLALAQKIVVVIGLAVVLLIVGSYVSTGGFAASRGGWFGYAPPTGDTYLVVRRYSLVRTLVVPVALVIVWIAASVWVLAPGDESGRQGVE